MNAQSLVCQAGDASGIARCLADNGAVVVRSALDPHLLDDLRRTTERLIRSRLAALGRPDSIEDVDDGYRRLCAIDPLHGQELIRVVRENEAFYHILLAPALKALVSAVMPDALPHLVFDNCMMRIDGPDDEGRRFDWHYDNAYLGMSEEIVVCWVPMTSVDPEMGCLRIVPGSHRRPQPIRLRHDLAKVPFSGPKRIELADADNDAFERDAVELPPMQPGDLALLDGFVLHRSGYNNSPRARWICNPRFGNLLEPALVERGWRIARPGNPFVFAEIHPECVVDNAPVA